MLTQIIIAILAFLVGFQLWKPDLVVLFGKINYRIQTAQWVSYTVALLLAAMLLYEGFVCCLSLRWLLFVVLVSAIGFVFEAVLARLNPRKALFTWTMRLVFVAVMGWLSLRWNFQPLFVPYCVWGILLRNTPCGLPHGKLLALATYLSRRPGVSFVQKSKFEPITDKPLFDVTQYGVRANVKSDQTDALQLLIDKVGAEGGGCIWFPAGSYYFKPSARHFLQINHSHITLAGATDADGHPLTELISMSPTLEGSRNPWISPFFITTGEVLQPSNIFFGLQFRNRIARQQQSSSLTDPGSDGTILTPAFATKVNAPSAKGEQLLHVDDSALCGKYVMLGMYNTSDDGNLIKDILGVEELRPEWTSANRAGKEQAPSYQHLLEVKRVVDEHTIELTTSLPRDVELKYEPALFNVPMLEDITIRDLRISSRWNGIFHHHGLPLYYSVRASQEMDYGWNGLNLKRVAHGLVQNVQIHNFTNPLYVFDSRDVVCRQLEIGGYDGHQGIKIYQHACNNVFEDITFRAHYADMMGGEGNAYENVFRRIEYLNPVFKPVGFDFHGFSEGPMSPPAFNRFEKIFGFAHIQSAAGRDMLPGCAQFNQWREIVTEGERHGAPLFVDLTYKPKTGLLRFVTAVGYTIAVMLKKRKGNPISIYNEKKQDMDRIAIPVSEHKKLFINSLVENIKTTCTFMLLMLIVSPLWADYAADERQAKNELTASNYSVVYKTKCHSGDKHNYESLAYYAWPDPKDPNAPYIWKDGQPSPEYNNYDGIVISRFKDRVRVLTSVYAKTGDKRYGDCAVEQLKVWFLNKDTRMNPNFNYGQFIPGDNRNGLGHTGAISEAYNLICILDCIDTLREKGAINWWTYRKLKKWFKELAIWLQTSDLGEEMYKMYDNHAVMYDLVCYRVAIFNNDKTWQLKIEDEFAGRRIEGHIAADGSMPIELKRTRAFMYSTYNLEHILELCERSLTVGRNYYKTQQKPIDAALAYLEQFIGHHDKFPAQELNWTGLDDRVRECRRRVEALKTR